MKDQRQVKELINRMLSGQLSQDEQHQLSRMMNKPGFRTLFNAVLDEQGGELKMEQDQPARSFTNEKLKLFYQQLPKKEAAIADEAPVLSMRRPLWQRMIPYAAIIVMAVSALLFWLSDADRKINTAMEQKYSKENGYAAPVEKKVLFTEHYNEGKRRLRVKLSDGSVVTIGRKSRIKYPAGFAGNRRDVYLQGEAFFEVTKDAGKPFTVYTGDVQTRVLGTSFKVSAIPKAAVEVGVVTGKVSVSYHGQNLDNHLAIMLPGDKISWKNNHLSKMKMEPKDVLAWKDEMIVFRKQSLGSILNVFRNHYGVKITVINKGFLAEKISLTLDEKMPLQKAMNVLSITAGFDHSFDSLSRTVIIK